MRKYIIWLFVILFFSYCQQVNKTYEKIIWIKSGLNDKNEAIGKEDTVAIEYFNEERLVRKAMFDRTNDSRTIEKTFFYDKDGKDIGFSFKLENTIANKTDLHRDSFGNITAVKTYGLNEGEDTVVVTYLNTLNSDSLAIVSKIIDKQNDSLKGMINYKYDVKKQLIEMKNFLVNDTGMVLDAVDTYSYDEKGNKLLGINEIPANKMKSKNTYEYGPANELLREKYFESDTLIHEISYTYENGRKKEAIMIYPARKERYRITFLYE